MFMSYGVLSLIAVVLILAIAVMTRRTLFAMAVGLTAGTIVVAARTNANVVDQWFGYLYTSLSNEDLQWLLILISVFGILIALFEKSNAVVDFGVWAGRFIRTKKAGLLGTFILGVVIFVDDYLNNLAVGTTMKGITDRLDVPRTQLGYVVNSAAAPICILIPFSSWAAYFGGLMEGQGVVGSDGTGLSAYIQGLPFTFYGFFAVIVVLLMCFGIMPIIGPMKKDVVRARETHNVFPEGTDQSLIDSVVNEELPDQSEAKPWNFLIPLAILIIFTFATGTDVLKGAGAGTLAAMILYLAERKFSFREMCEYSFEGVMNMGFVLVLSVLAFAVQALNGDLGLSDFIIDVTLPIMKGAFLPMVVFLVCAVYAYATGCFWDLAAIILPLVVPLATAMHVDPIIACSAVFSGAAFGSNTCLYGDGIIICSQGVQIKAVDLMLATLPYACIAGGATAVAYLVTGFVLY